MESVIWPKVDPRNKVNPLVQEEGWRVISYLGVVKCFKSSFLPNFIHWKVAFGVAFWTYRAAHLPYKFRGALTLLKAVFCYLLLIPRKPRKYSDITYSNQVKCDRCLQSSKDRTIQFCWTMPHQPNGFGWKFFFGLLAFQILPAWQSINKA